MEKAKFQFSNVVVVQDDLIGVIVKTWFNEKKGYIYEVYVRSWNGISEHPEEEIEHFVYSKELSSEELEFYK